MQNWIPDLANVRMQSKQYIFLDCSSKCIYRNIEM